MKNLIITRKDATMKRYLVVLFLTLGLAHGFGTGCSSGDSASEDGESAIEDAGTAEELSEEDVDGESEFAEGDEEFMDEGEDEFAEGDDEFAEGDEGGDEFAEGGEEAGEEVAESEDEEFGDEFGEEGGETGGEEALAESEEGFSDEGSEDVAAAPAEEVVGGESEIAEGAIDDSMVEDSGMGDGTGAVEDTAMADSGESDFSGGAVGGFVPVKKIRSAPFTKAGSLLNTVYIARPGDTLSSISQKIYNEDRSSSLLAWNNTLGRGVKVGDKVYYNSSRRPNDSNRMLTYYEDVGIEAQHYFSKPGDNIRVVSRQLLGSDGHERSWMEVWATNLEVESKDEIAGGIDLRYWPPGGAPSASPMMTDTSLPSEPFAAAGTTADPGMAIAPEPMPDMTDPMGANNFQGGLDPMAANTADPGIPDIPDVPVPDPSPAGAAAGIAAGTPGTSPSPAATAGADEDMTMTLALVGVVLLAAVGLMVVMKKNRTRRMDLTQTQI
jgi:hypothetical protein